MLAALVDPPAQCQLFDDPRRSCSRHLYTTRKTFEREWVPAQLCVSQCRAHEDEPVGLRQFVFWKEDGGAQAPQGPHHVGDYEDGTLLPAARFHWDCLRLVFFGRSKVCCEDIALLVIVPTHEHFALPPPVPPDHRAS